MPQAGWPCLLFAQLGGLQREQRSAEQGGGRGVVRTRLNSGVIRKAWPRPVIFVAAQAILADKQDFSAWIF